MNVNWNYVGSFILSIVLHGVLITLLIFSIDNTVRQAPQPVPQVNIVKAVSVDSKEVEKELKRLQDIEKEKESKQQKKQKELERKLKELEKKSAKATASRKAEEKKLAQLKKKKAAEKKKREEEQKKLSQLKKEQQELEKQKKAEQERQAKEAAEQKRKEEEDRLQAELAEEQKQLEAAQKSRDQQLLQNIVGKIKRSIASNFNKSGLPKGLECVLSVRLVPGGVVTSVTISKSSGSDVFDRRALVAVQKASPLPMIPEDSATFERLRLRQFAFRFKPED
ncbi:MAG: cell envelope integrity protein TolA [Gammaproteobacteria bacterium]|nr:cell envelope integrity protein TolA [Gammaproteobacteria bacterium]